MESKAVCITQIVFFFMLIATWYYLATRKNATTITKIGEVATMYGAIFVAAFSRTISLLIFILTACWVVIFNLNKAKNERRNKATDN